MTTPADDLRAAHAALLAWGRARAEKSAGVGRWLDVAEAQDRAVALADSLATATDTTSGTGRGEG